MRRAAHRVELPRNNCPPFLILSVPTTFLCVDTRRILLLIIRPNDECIQCSNEFGIFITYSGEWIWPFRSMHFFSLSNALYEQWAIELLPRTVNGNDNDLFSDQLAQTHRVIVNCVRLLRTKTHITRNPKMNKSFLLLILRFSVARRDVPTANTHTKYLAWVRLSVWQNAK